MAFAVKSAQPRESIAPALRSAIAAADRNLPIARLVALDEVASRFLVTQRLSMTLMTAFALVALAMAAIGLYGVLAMLVAQQTREIGIRMALGANRSQVRRRVVLAGVRVAIGGVALGAMASGTAAALIGRFLPSLPAPRWPSIGGFALVLLAAAVAAAWVPAQRASAVDPISALRTE
jgi:ABC-type antimicrobial peptide transport system permease subunit